MNENFLKIQDVTFAASQKNKVSNVTFNLDKEGEKRNEFVNSMLA